MDSGEVIPGLNDGWTFAGARSMEWASGFVMAIIIQEAFLSTPARTMPLFLGILLATTFSMAAMRRSFPDEERGVANLFLVHLGICPPGIPSPASLQPLWSATPMQQLDEKKEFVELGLFDVFPNCEEEEEDSLDYFHDEPVH